MRTRWIAIAALLLAAPARAQVELVTDGGFDDAAHAAWDFEIFDGSTIAWTSQDADGGVPGSLLFQKKVGESPNSLRASQCIDVVPEAEYAISALSTGPRHRMRPTANPSCGSPGNSGRTAPARPVFPTPRA